MCVIVDANVAGLIFRQDPDPDFVPVLRWLDERDGCMVVGGRLKQELYASAGVRTYIRRLNQAGRATLFRDDDVNAEERAVRRTGLCVSDDPHIIGLARVSGARTLCSIDKDLHTDFKSRRLIDKPGGRVYQSPDHEPLLCHTPSCRRQA